MCPLILFILIIVITKFIADLYHLLTKDIGNYIAPSLKETDETNIPSSKEIFFDDTRYLLLSHGFQKQSQYLFEAEKDSNGYLEYYVHHHKGISAWICQIVSTNTYDHEEHKSTIFKKKKNFIFSLASCFDDQTHIITTSNPNYLDTPKHILIFSHPLMPPKQILEVHEKNIIKFSKDRNLNYDILKKSFSAFSAKQAKMFTDHLVNTKTLRYKAKKQTYCLTLRGYFKFRWAQMKSLILRRAKAEMRKNNRAVKYHVTSEEVRSNPRSKSSFQGGIMALVFGSLLTSIGIWNIYKASQSNHWSKTQGKIISFTVEDDFDSIDAQILYQYVVDGKTYISDKTSFGDIVTKSDAEVERLKKKYGQPESLVDVYYDPKNPSHAILEKGNNYYSFFPFIMGAIVILFTIPSFNKEPGQKY